MIHITLIASPFSINSAYYNKGNGKVRTAECRRWGDAVLEQLQSYSEEMKEFTAAFEVKLHGIDVELTHFIPEKFYYNYEKTISSRSPDITNIEKLLIDLVFDARFFGRNDASGKKIVNLNINDKNIVSCLSKKLPSYEYRVELKISIIPLPVSEVDPNEYAEEE